VGRYISAVHTFSIPPEAGSSAVTAFKLFFQRDTISKYDPTF
jgi:hypothetical protein